MTYDIETWLLTIENVQVNYNTLIINMYLLSVFFSKFNNVIQKKKILRLKSVFNLSHYYYFVHIKNIK